MSCQDLKVYQDFIVHQVHSMVSNLCYFFFYSFDFKIIYEKITITLFIFGKNNPMILAGYTCYYNAYLFLNIFKI